jgi:RHS repeat-associated protein
MVNDPKDGGDGRGKGPAQADTSRTRKAAEAPKPTEAQVAAPVQEGPRATFAALKPPTLSLPQGGGAMRSIGETFKANPVTGTLSASIPIPVSPLPRGPVPQMALSYDSGSGNGPFGHGWSLGVPQIMRRTDRKLPEYLDSEDSDEFLFGGEALVPVFDDAGDRYQRTETLDAVSYRVERFMPRTEGAFTRIERWTKTAPGPANVFWEARGADNSWSRFGLSSASRIAHPDCPERVFAWLIDDMRDDRGSVVSYGYVAESDDGVSLAPPAEARRVRSANRYLKSVKYGNATPCAASVAPTDQRVEIVFDYGQCDATAPLPGDANTMPSRPDPFSTYRSGFEVRTHRLCKRVLVFHSFSGSPELVRALELSYNDADPGRFKLSQLLSARVVGFTPDGSGAYTFEELPSVTFTYSAAPFEKAIHTLPKSETEDFNPWALNGASQWVDLDGEGLPGLLSDRGRALKYKRNLGEGHLAFGRTLPSAPNMRLASSGGGAQLMDVEGSGTMAMVRLDPRAPGFQERTADGWGPFRPFPNVPNVDWRAPNLRMIDLDGDGFEDILITRGDHFLWYPSLGKGGWGPSRRVPIPAEREQGPAIVFAGRFSAVFLADMTGDGLVDIVRVLHSRVSYWPNLGYGRFGAEVVMSTPPIDLPHAFHPVRVRLADLDGTGTADLIYFNQDGMHVFENRAGNSFALRQTNECVPTASALPTLSIVDLHGVGMSTLVWAPARSNEPQVRHTSPYGTKKPYLLEAIDNGMGLEASFEYAPSTKFYLADRLAGQPWATKLPFPVQVLTHVESYDRIAKRIFATSYSYHHGFYDTHEREFRGFGRVDSLDTETFDENVGSGVFADLPIENGELQQPPVLTKTWFHTGAWNEKQSLEAAFAAERFTGDGDAPAPISCVFHDVLPVAEIREAHRALRGTMLRQEVYGTDNLTVPYAVSETSYEVIRRQERKPALGEGRSKLHAVFQLLPRESRAYAYDRSAGDPRVTQWVALDYDDAYGFVTKSLSVAYARRESARLAAVTAEGVSLTEQSVTHAVASETAIAHWDSVADAYRLAVPLESAAYELTGLTGSSPIDRASLISSYATASAATLLEYDQGPTSGLQRRIVSRIKVRYYDSASLPNPLAFGAIDALALVNETYQLDLTSGIVTSVFGTAVDATVLGGGGYVTPAGEAGYWVPSGRSLPDATKFYLPVSFTDPFGNTTGLTYDTHKLFVAQVADPLGNTVGAEHDYRALAPSEVTDPNGNRVQAAFDDLGRVVKVAVMGKATGSDGDTLSNPTQEFIYVTTAWSSGQTPNYVHAKARKQHGGTASWQETFTYSDGSGAVAMVKAQAEPDELTPTTPRWIGSGKTVVNNKGNIVKQYEPYFSSTSAYQTEEAIAAFGVTALYFYDPIGRLIRVDLPSGAYRKTDYGVWKTTAWDEHDTLSDTANPWRLARASLPSGDPERIAYEAALLHADTPSRVFADAMGRAFLAVAHNKNGATDVFYQTRTALDIEGYPKSVTDPLIRVCQTQTFSIAGQLLSDTNIDKGTRKTVADVAGGLLRRIDDRSQTFRAQHDALRRVTHLWVKVGTAAETLLERRYYGDDAGITTPDTTNLKGRLVALYDQAGLFELGPYDFKGNLLESARTLALTYNAALDWGILASVTSAATAKTSTATLRELETFGEARAYDALNRVTSFTTPDASEYLPTYNEGSLLETVGVKVRGSATTTTFVSGVAYNEKGQRTKVVWGNGTTTEYTYDTLTYRLERLLTTRTSPANTLQDLQYTFDAVGNVVRIADGAQQTVFFDNAVVAPLSTYQYDALYRLIAATGREHKSIGDVQVDQNDCPLQNLPHANQPDAVRNYTETYGYDAVGNILEMFHSAEATPNATWTRTYSYTSGANRLASHTAPGGSVTFSHDAHGNMTAMPHLSGGITSSAFDQMSSASNGSQTTYFTYDAGGQRVRKVFVDGINIKERIYIGSYEVYRERVTSPVPLVMLERETLHVMDGARRVAMLETKTIDAGDPVSAPTSLFRFQLDNHLGSACLELNLAGLVISYEEYHPYGSTSYRASPSGVEVSARRYRYTGKERDEETGLYYYGARYYAAWLGRWTSADPLGLQAGINLYLYCRAGPITYTDPTGTLEIKAPTPTQLHQAAQSDGKVHVKLEKPQLSESDVQELGRQNVAEAKAAVATIPKGQSREQLMEKGVRQFVETATREAAAIAAYRSFQQSNPAQDPDNPANPNFDYFLRRSPEEAGSDVAQGFKLTHEPATGTSTLARALDFILPTPASEAQTARTGTRGLDTMAGRLGGELFPESRIPTLRRHLERRGIELVTDADALLPGSKAAGFNAETRQLFLRSNPTRMEVQHELVHFLDYQRLGEAAYYARPQSVREQVVFDVLSNNTKRWEGYTEAQRAAAVEQIFRVGGIR